MVTVMVTVHGLDLALGLGLGFGLGLGRGRDYDLSLGLGVGRSVSAMILVFVLIFSLASQRQRQLPWHCVSPSPGNCGISSTGHSWSLSSSQSAQVASSIVATHRAVGPLGASGVLGPMLSPPPSPSPPPPSPLRAACCSPPAARVRSRASSRCSSRSTPPRRAGSPSLCWPRRSLRPAAA